MKNLHVNATALHYVWFLETLRENKREKSKRKKGRMKIEIELNLTYCFHLILYTHIIYFNSVKIKILKYVSF